MNPDGKRSEKVEAEDGLRTVECLRGRLLAERVASRNAKEEVERMENKLIELEKKLIEEYKSKNRAEKKLKFLMKKLQSMNIPYISCESERSGSGSVARSEISSTESSATSPSTKEVDEEENNVNSANSSIDGNHDNPAAGRTNCSSDGVNSPQLTIQKKEIEEFKEKKFESPTASNNFEQNACSFAKNQDNPASQNVVEKSDASSVSNNSEQNPVPENFQQSVCSFIGNCDNPATGRTNSSSDGVNSHQLTIQKEEIEEFQGKKFESPTASSNSEQNACSFAKNQDNPESQKVMEKSESSSVSNKCEQNACSFARNQDNPESQNVVEMSDASSVSNDFEQNACSFDRNQDNPESQKMVEMSESSSVSNNSEQNSRSSPEYYDASVAGKGTGEYSNCVNSPELTMKIQTESPIDSIKCEQDACGSCEEDHETTAATATETISSRNRIDFPELATKEDKINEFQVKNEFPAVSIKQDQNACTNNQRHGSSGTPQEIYSDHNEPHSSQKPKKHDRSLRTLLKKEKMDEENIGEHDDQVDNSLALVPVDLPMPMPKQRSVDPVILDATVKEVLGSLRNAKAKLLRSMERRRSNMIKVG